MTPARRTSRRSAAPPPHLLEEIGRGGATFEEVVLTRNRRVMVSVGGGGRVLRLHEAFREAPASVLRAVGELLSRKGRRSAARETVTTFLSEIRPPSGARRRRRVPPGDRPYLERLTAEFERVNARHFQGTLPRLPLFLSGRMRSRNGHFSSDPLEIVISRRLCEGAEEGEALATLRHEMIHLWQHQQGVRPGHGADFREWARRLDVHPRARRAVGWRSGAGC